MVSLEASAQDSVHVLPLVQKVSRVNYGQCSGSDIMWIPGFNTTGKKLVVDEPMIGILADPRNVNIKVIFT